MNSFEYERLRGENEHLRREIEKMKGESLRIVNVGESCKLSYPQVKYFTWEGDVYEKADKYIGTHYVKCLTDPLLGNFWDDDIVIQPVDLIHYRETDRETAGPTSSDCTSLREQRIEPDRRFC